MSYEQRDNTGSLFRNERKESEKHPDYSGTCTIDGKQFFFDGWLKTSESGKKWMSFSFKEKQAKKDKAEAWKAGQPLAAQDDDIPW